MLCNNLLVAHVPHPNNLVYYHKHGIVNTSFVAGVCLFANFFCTFANFFCTAFVNATDSRGGTWLARANSAPTTFYNRIMLFDVSN